MKNKIRAREFLKLVCWLSGSFSLHVQDTLRKKEKIRAREVERARVSPRLKRTRLQALATVLELYAPALPADAAAAAWVVWLQYLPLRADAEENDSCARTLARLAHGFPAPLALAAIARVATSLDAAEPPTTAAAAERLREIEAKQPVLALLAHALRQLQAAPGKQAEFQQACAQLDLEQREALQALAGK